MQHILNSPVIADLLRMHGFCIGILYATLKFYFFMLMCVCSCTCAFARISGSQRKSLGDLLFEAESLTELLLAD